MHVVDGRRMTFNRLLGIDTQPHNARFVTLAICRTAPTLGLFMKRFLATLLLGTTLAAWADHGPTEPTLSVDDKAGLVKILGEALRDNDITQPQYDQSVSWVNATPCTGVDRGLTAKQQAQLEAAVAKQQKLKKVSVFESFKSDGWYIVFSDASVGDSPYFFYSKNPMKGAKPLTAWSGSATIFETSEVAEWVKQNASGIPERLANCFAWHVTLSPE